MSGFTKLGEDTKLDSHATTATTQETFKEIELTEIKFAAPKPDLKKSKKAEEMKSSMKYLNSLVGLCCFYFSISFVLSQITIVWPKQISLIVNPRSKEFYNGVIGIAW
jgi:hypothetical protein